MRVVIQKQVGSAMRDASKMRRQHARIYLQSVGSAMKRGAASAKTEARRAVSAATGIKQKAIKGRLGSSRRPKPDRITVFFSGALMPPEAYSAPRQTKRGVRAGRHAYDGAFLARSTRSGKETTFKRRGPARGPIQRQGVDLHQHRQTFLSAAAKGFRSTYTKRLIHEYDRRLRKAGLK